MGKAYGVESHVLSPAETKALYPLMNVDDLYGTLYVPHDGTMDPAGTCVTLTRAAAARGAQVLMAAEPWAPRCQPAEGGRRANWRRSLCNVALGPVGLLWAPDLLLQSQALPRGQPSSLPEVPTPPNK